ncbi:N-acetylmuramidase family protein [Burkholderia cepacia]|uniref:N-acetylmuramidase family protein n=1 Tax=Burkholderia cepacia TaxID=292 RepID=UPI001FC8E819|nr:N-acetylmuramidase family protein [Burkholderia cepacia]
MAHPHSSKAPAVKAVPTQWVQTTIVFRDVLQKPIEGLSVQLKPAKEAPPAPAWKVGPDPATVVETPPAKTDGPSPAAGSSPAAAMPASGAAATAPTSAQPGKPAVPASASGTATSPAQPAAAGKPAPTEAAPPAEADSPPVSDNQLEITTDKDGYAATITNAARNQPIDVFVKNRRGEYAWKAKIVPKTDISAFTIVSPEYHIEATTKLTPKDEFEQNLNLPVVKNGENMTIQRLVTEFGPYIAFTQAVTEQGRVKKDFPTTTKEDVVDPKTKKKKTKLKVEHHYKVVNTGTPRAILFNVLGSRLNYPKTLEISEERFAQVAKDLSCEVAAIKAVAMTESHGLGFCDNGLPKIRYERHIFFRALLPKKKRNEKDSLVQKEVNPFPQYPNLCFPKRGGYSEGETDDRGWKSLSDEQVMYQYERFLRACALNQDAAIMACSWGAFQVLAIYWEEMGYASPMALADQTMKGADEQFDLFVAYVRMNQNALDALREKNWEDFSYYYNGPGYSADYPKSMKDFYAKFK